MTTQQIPGSLDAVTPEWLTRTLHHAGCLPAGIVSGVTKTVIGEGRGVLSLMARLTLSYEGTVTPAPNHLVVKLPALAAQNRYLGANYGLYEREVRFYQELSSRVPLRTPVQYAAEVEPASGDFVLLLEDLSGGTVAEQVDGCSAEQAEAVITHAARLHGAWWQHSDLGSFPWLPDGAEDEALRRGGDLFRMSWPIYLARFGDDCPATTVTTGERLGPRFEEMQRHLMSGPVTLCHGDLRLDNLFFDLPDSPVAAIDWQILRRGRGMFDTSYFLGTNLAVDMRRQHENDLLRRYHDELLSLGVRDYSFDQCIDDYRRALLDCFLALAVVATLEPATPREAALAKMMNERVCAANADWETGTLLKV